MKYLFSSIVLIFCTVSVFAQPVNKSSKDQLISAAEYALEQKDYYSALENYEKYNKEERDINITYKIAGLHYKLRNYHQAERVYKRILTRKNSRKFKNPYTPEVRFEVAQMMKLNGKYTEAIEAFQLYIGEAEDIERIKAAKKEITGCEMALEMGEAPGISVVNAGKRVNARYSEASPVMVNGQDLYYAGMRRNDLLIYDGKKDEGDVVSQIYKASRNGEGFSKAVAIEGDNIPREGYHLGNLTLSPDGERMYFTRATLNGNELETSELFTSAMGSEGWGPANPVVGVNGEYIVRHPALGELFNQEVLFFSSNREGGFGGYDIYYSTRSGDGWEAPVNLGEIINTPDDELTPYYVDGTLYFSSNGLISMGGFDIYNTVWNGSVWSEPNNIGKPYNSPVDDLYFSIDKEGYNGFLVSNREGTVSVNGKTCCDDIWVVSKEKVVLELITNLFNDKNQPLDSVKIEITDMVANEIGERRTRMRPDTNSYTFSLLAEKSYKIVATRKGYYPDSLTFNTVGIDSSQMFVKNIPLRPLPPPPPAEPVEEYEEYTINEPIRLNNIYYDFDDDKILEDAEPDLQVILELMSQYPDMVIELGSHTDSQGATQYNRDLSQRRAESARKWLIRRKVDSDRIKAKGYGESVILNQCKNGVQCTDDEHRFNRRTEFKIIAGPKTIQIKKTRLRKKS